MTTAQTQQTPPAAAATATVEIAVVGNPNTGKTTLFNRLTGARQRVGNYPGVTVEKKLGTVHLPDGPATVIDLPGAYSLAAVSADEQIVLDVITGRVRGTRPPDVIVCVVDATRLTRNLFLASQLADTGVPMVLALNMTDAAEAQGVKIDAEQLSQRLGVPVVRTVASKNRGTDELKQAIARQLKERKTMPTVDWPQPVRDAVAQLRQAAENDSGEAITEAEALRLLFDVNSAAGERLPWPDEQRDAAVHAARAILTDAGINPAEVESLQRYSFLREHVSCVMECPLQPKRDTSESIDDLLTHRFWGLVIFVAVMYCVFWAIYTGATPMMDGIEATFGALGDWIAPMLASTPMLQSLVVDGVIAGVGGVVVFLPQIMILFFFLALLEDTGYLARAAFLMDKLFSWCGLSGKSFVPLLSSYACAIPGIMGARTIEQPKARLVTILIAPLMSCSARLPVYVLMIGAFIEPQYGASVSAFVLFLMHFVGLAVALPIAWGLNRLIFRTQRSPFVLELPPYRVPRLRDVMWRMWERGREFIYRAGTVIFAITIVVWALCYFPRPAEVEQQVAQQFIEQRDVTMDQIEQDPELAAQLDRLIEGAFIEQSYLGRAGKTVQPIFAPAGFDWKITVGLLGSFPAREVIIATLGIIYNLGGDVDEEDSGLIEKMQSARHPDGAKVFTVPVAMAIMVFFALCMQCGSTLAIMKRETSWGWALFSFVYMTALAWVGAVVTYQVGTAILA